MPGRFIRLAETDRAPLTLRVDGQNVRALQGDTLMVALLATSDRLRQSEFGGEVRAGFCLMGACQDCWVWTSDGARLRACSTPAEDGMDISTQQPEATWSERA